MLLRPIFTTLLSIVPILSLLVGSALTVPSPQDEPPNKFSSSRDKESEETIDAGTADDVASIKCMLCTLPPPNIGPCPLKGTRINLHNGIYSKQGESAKPKYYNGENLEKSSYAVQIWSAQPKAALFSLSNFNMDHGKSSKQHRLFQLTWHGANGEKATQTYFLDGYDSCDGVLENPLLDKLGKASVEVVVADA